MAETSELILKPGRDRALRRRHPWVMSGAVAELREAPAAPAGALVRVRAADGEVLGWGDASPASQIRVRMLGFGAEPPAADWIEARIRVAVGRRADDPLVGDTDAVRLVNAEGDGLPGLVVDRYADVVVVRASSRGMAGRLDRIAEALREATGAARGYQRSDSAQARREGIPVQEGPLWGGAPEEAVAIRERDRRFQVDVRAGQKTGFYLDQRDARDLVARLATGQRVLDAFSYTGGFAVAAARGGAASVTLVDSSGPALERAARHLADNAPGVPARLEKADAFSFVRHAGDAGPFDLLVLDPPPLARRRADVPRASRAYKDLLMHALDLAAPGARVLFFACSHHVPPELLDKIVFGASLDAGRPLRRLATLGAPADHPVSVDHPEGRYLSGVLVELA